MAYRPNPCRTASGRPARPVRFQPTALNERRRGGTALRVPARVTAMSTDDEILKTLREARQGILWKIVENLNTGPTDVDKLRGLAAAYNLLSQSGTRPFES